MHIEVLYRVFALEGGHRKHEKYSPGAVVITPQYTSSQVVQNAWNEACIGAADGYQKLNFEDAVNRLMIAHPDWQIIQGTQCVEIAFSPRYSRQYPPRLSAYSNKRCAHVEAFLSPQEKLTVDYDLPMLLLENEAEALTMRSLEADLKNRGIGPVYDLKITYSPEFE